MNDRYVIGIDLGGTNIRGGLLHNNQLERMCSQPINAQGSVEAILRQVFDVIAQLQTPGVSAIGVGVPGLVDATEGIVYDAVNIPSWKEVELASILQEHFGLPVSLDNDANCFALAEFHFGKGRGAHTMVGLSIGTGLGSGIILNSKLYSGATGGAGEFGTSDYLDKCYEYYASGQFFNNVYGIDGSTVFESARSGDPRALEMYEAMGEHLGNAIKMILYALDVDLIVLGGSVSAGFAFFQKAVWRQLESFVFQRIIKKLRIEVSDLEHPGILGAASLCFDK